MPTLQVSGGKQVKKKAEDCKIHYPGLTSKAFIKFAAILFTTFLFHITVWQRSLPFTCQIEMKKREREYNNNQNSTLLRKRILIAQTRLQSIEQKILIFECVSLCHPIICMSQNYHLYD